MMAVFYKINNKKLLSFTMAGNSSTFYLRQEINQSNIKQWQNWSIDINYVVDQFNDVIQNLTDRLSVAEMTIDALYTKLHIADNKYVKLQIDSIEINSQKNIAYTKPCGVYSCNNDQPHMISIYSTKSVDGLYINDTQVTTSKDASDNWLPFLQISGSDAGTIVTVKSDNMTKTGSSIDLYFGLDASLPNGSIGTSFNPSNDNIARLMIKPIYSQSVIKPILTIDKSALSKTLVKTTAVSTDAIPVSKQISQIGVYSTPKTLSTRAKNLKK